MIILNRAARLQLGLRQKSPIETSRRIVQGAWGWPGKGAGRKGNEFFSIYCVVIIRLGLWRWLGRHGGATRCVWTMQRCGLSAGRSFSTGSSRNKGEDLERSPLKAAWARGHAGASDTGQLGLSGSVGWLPCRGNWGSVMAKLCCHVIKQRNPALSWVLHGIPWKTVHL